MGMVNCSLCGQPVLSRSAYFCDECHRPICPDCVRAYGSHCCLCQQDDGL